MSNLDQGYYSQHRHPGQNAAVVAYYEVAEKLKKAMGYGMYISPYCVQWRKFSNCYWVHVLGQRPRFVSFGAIS